MARTGDITEARPRRYPR